MPEYTAMENLEIRFSWNNEEDICIGNNRNRRDYVSVVVNLYLLKLISDSFYTKIPEVRFTYDCEEYKAFISEHTSKITIVGTIQDRRRKGYRHPISFSINALDKVIEMVEGA